MPKTTEREQWRRIWARALSKWVKDDGEHLTPREISWAMTRYEMHCVSGDQPMYARDMAEEELTLALADEEQMRLEGRYGHG